MLKCVLKCNKGNSISFRFLIILTNVTDAASLYSFIQRLMIYLFQLQQKDTLIEQNFNLTYVKFNLLSDPFESFSLSSLYNKK